MLTRHTNLGETRTPSRQQITFNDCADDLFGMVASGDFPDLSAPTAPRRGAPRASDGLIRLDVDGITTFASPNALSAFNRMGFDDELEGESLDRGDDAASSRPSASSTSRCRVVVTGRAPWRTDIEARGVTVSLRTIPLRDRGNRIGAIVLCRDVTEIRHQEQELITKDATIREIHHRVKNNLQTVASLLRIQARRSHSEEAREALTQAMRRVAAIAVVHDTLSEGLAQTVDFDEVFDRVLKLVAEVAAAPNTRARTRSTGHVRHAAERVRDAARPRPDRARHQRRRARAGRPGGRRRDHRRARGRAVSRCACATPAPGCRRVRSAGASARRSCAR